MRRAMDLDVSDRIELTVGSDDDVAHAALAARQRYLAEQVLAVDVRLVPLDDVPSRTGDGSRDSAELSVGTGVDAPVRVAVRPRP